MLPTGDERRGLGAGRTRWAAALAAAYETGPVELLANIAYLRNRNTVSERGSVWRVSGAVLYSLTEKLRLVVDYDRHTLPDPNDGSHGRELVAGAIYAFSDRVELGLGLKKGLNDAADDRSVRAGIKLRW
jgi:predicted porin